MIEAPISTPPQAYMDIISSLIDKARELLEAGEKLQAFAFVGNLTTKEVIPVMIQPGSIEDKDQSARRSSQRRWHWRLILCSRSWKHGRFGQTKCAK